jgi:hypothetical protein
VIDLLRQRLARHPIRDARAEEQALKEILQEVALYALWRGGKCCGDDRGQLSCLVDLANYCQ